MHGPSPTQGVLIPNYRDIVSALNDEEADYLLDGAYATAVVRAVESLRRRDGESHEDFVRRAGRDPIGRRVKRADLEDNVDLSCIAAQTTKDLERIERYRHALEALESRGGGSVP